MSWSLERLRPASTCEALIRETNAFIARAYDSELDVARGTFPFPEVYA